VVARVHHQDAQYALVIGPIQPLGVHLHQAIKALCGKWDLYIRLHALCRRADVMQTLRVSPSLLHLRCLGGSCWAV
jgi:hypothetical protein